MLHPVRHAGITPDKPAYIMAGTGETVTYAELDARANAGAQLIRSLGLKRGDGVAVLMDNSPRYLEVMWAAERTGVYCTCISSKLTAAEAKYIVRDGDCRLLIASHGVADLAAALQAGSEHPLARAVLAWASSEDVKPARADGRDAGRDLHRCDIGDEQVGARCAGFVRRNQRSRKGADGRMDDPA